MDFAEFTILQVARPQEGIIYAGKVWIPMDLFSSDMFRSFLTGFGVTAVVLVVAILPRLSGG